MRGSISSSAIVLADMIVRTDRRLQGNDDANQGEGGDGNEDTNVPVFGIILAAVGGVILLGLVTYCCCRMQKCDFIYKNGCLKVICIGCLGCAYCCPKKAGRKRLQKGNLSTEDDGIVTMA